MLMREGEDYDEGLKGGLSPVFVQNIFPLFTGATLKDVIQARYADAKGCLSQKRTSERTEQRRFICDTDFWATADFEFRRQRSVP